MKKISFISIFAIFFVFLFGCGSNKYMIRDTKEYGNVTRYFIGNWAVAEYKVSSNNLLDTTFDKIAIEFDFATRTAKFTFWVSEGKLAEKLIDWKKKFPNLEITEYKIVVTTQWRISESGNILYFDEQKPNLVIKGSGENFEGFYTWERTRFEAGKNIGKDKGLAGMLMNKAAKVATGTNDLFPHIPSQSNFRFSKDKRFLSIRSIDGVNIKLHKN